MKNLLFVLFLAALVSCQSGNDSEATQVLFLHHSTGYAIWRGKTNPYVYKVTGKGDVAKYFSRYNKEHRTNYQVIVFKHCYPVGDILEDTGTADMDSDEKRLENYKLQYSALKEKMHEFTENKFILSTPAARVRNATTEEKALRTRQFHERIVNEWDEEGDNIYLWDFYRYETEGELYLQEAYASGYQPEQPGHYILGSSFCFISLKNQEVLCFR